MTSFLSDSLPGVLLRACVAVLLTSALAHAQEQEPPPPPAATRELPESVVLPSSRAREPLAEPGDIKIRLDGEYEARLSFLTSLPLAPIAGDASLGQTSRLYHWLRLRGLALFGARAELRAEADVPRGMLYGHEPESVPDNGTDFDRQQPVRVSPRMLRLTLRGAAGELSVGHTTSQLGLGLVDADGDQPRWFGTPDVPATYERIEVSSGAKTSTLRVGASGDMLFDDGHLSLSHGDHLLRVALTAAFAPSTRSHLKLLARYEALAKKDQRGGAQTFVVDASGGFRSPVPGRSAELFGEYEAAYRVGAVSEPTAFAASGADASLASVGFAARVGVAFERALDYRRFAHFVASVEWGMASGDADPTDDGTHRFVFNANHGVGLILFSEILRFKTSRAQALLQAQNAGAGGARVEGLATRGGVAGANYLNPVLLLRPTPDLAFKLGGVVASSLTPVIDPSALASRGARQNFDGGSSLGRSLGTELDVGGELTLPLDAPMLLRLSVEGALAFPGSAFDDAEGHHLGKQAMTTAGLGLTF